VILSALATLWLVYVLRCISRASTDCAGRISKLAVVIFALFVEAHALIVNRDDYGFIRPVGPWDLTDVVTDSVNVGRALYQQAGGVAVDVSPNVVRVLGLYKLPLVTVRFELVEVRAGVWVLGDVVLQRSVLRDPRFKG
jgi:hypothetical protein